MTKQFDYEQKVWGSGEMSLNPTCLGALRLKYCFEALDNLPIGGRVLDAGCGAGAFSRAIKRWRPDLHIIGIDISSNALNQAKNRSSDIKYFLGNITKIPKNIGQFDAIVSFDVLEHLAQPDLVLKSLVRVLKPNGIIHFYVPLEGNPGTVYKIWPFLKKLKLPFTGHIQNFSKSEIKKLLNNLGLTTVVIKNSDYWLYQITDAGFFVFLTIFRKKTYSAVEGYIASQPEKFSVKLLAILKNLFACITYIESRLFSRFDGLGIHVTARKI